MRAITCLRCWSLPRQALNFILVAKKLVKNITRSSIYDQYGSTWVAVQKCMQRRSKKDWMKKCIMKVKPRCDDWRIQGRACNGWNRLRQWWMRRDISAFIVPHHNEPIFATYQWGGTHMRSVGGDRRRHMTCHHSIWIDSGERQTVILGLH